MKEVLLSSLEAGTTTIQEYFTREGAVLIPSGTLLSQEYLEKMKARGIETVYSKEIQTPELKEDIEEIYKSQTSGTCRNQAWKEGLIQLIKSNKGADLDSLIKDGKNPDKPSGPMLKDKALVRLQTGKDQMTVQRNRSKTCTREPFSGSGQFLTLWPRENWFQRKRSDPYPASLSMFSLTDRDILLNISGTKPSEGDYVYHHSLNVCILSFIAASFGYNEQQIIEIGMGALLHDAGMLLVPKDVRYKNEQLDEDDWSELRKHPILGLHLIDKIKGLRNRFP